MKIVIENKSKAKDRDVIEMISDRYDYIGLENGASNQFSVKDILISVSCKKNITTFIVEDLKE